MKKDARGIEQIAISKIALLIEEFGGLFAARKVSSDAGALDAIEEDWAKLQRETEKVYEQMVSELTNAIDERDMIAKKN